jgi:hypothetical protein
MKPLELQAAGGLAGTSAAQGDARERGGQAWRNAWQKEMEGLQAGAWLGHGLVAGQGGDASAQAAARGTAQDQTSRVRHETQQLQAEARRPGEGPIDAARRPMRMQPKSDWAVRWLSVAGEPAFENEAMATAMNAMAAVVAAAAPATVQATARWNAGLVVDPAPAPVATSFFAPRRANVPAAPDEAAQGQPAKPVPPPSPTERQAVRFHAEWSALGVRLWLGMDAQAAATAGLLVAQLQRSITAAGSRLLSLTCNGQDMPLSAGAQPSVFPLPPFAEKMETRPWPSTQ